MVEAGREPTPGRTAARIANELHRRGLAAPARLLADAHRPLAPLLSDLGVALGGLLGAVGGPAMDSVRSLIAEESALDELIAELDAVEVGHAQPG